MKEISILTFCNNMWHVNYGQVLQCYAMQEICKKLGANVQVVRYREKVPQDILKYKFPLGKMNELYEDYCQRIFIQNGFDERINKFQKFVSKNINRTYPCYTIADVEKITQKSDVLICGSDQIWNPNLLKKVYALDFGTAIQKKVAYAASGIVPKSKYADKKYKELSKYLQNFSSISLREKVSIDILKDYTAQKIEDVLDPTFLLKSKEWDKVAGKYLIDEPYIFCYTLCEIRPYKMMLNKIAELYGVKKVLYIQSKVIPGDYSGKFVKISDAGPAEFLTLLKNSVTVCTDSFHGVALSINYHKQFCLFNHKTTDISHCANRQDDILAKCHINNRKCENLKDINNLVPINYKEVEAFLSKERERSWEFLKKSVE